MDVLGLLERDHRRTRHDVDELASLVADGSSDDQVPARTIALVRSMRLQMAAEERVVYQTALSLDGPSREAAIAGRIHHELLGRVLDRLETTQPGPDGELAAVLRVLVGLVELHLQRLEEDLLFPHLRADLTPDERASLGAALIAEREHLRSAAGLRGAT